MSARNYNNNQNYQNRNMQQQPQINSGIGTMFLFEIKPNSKAYRYNITIEDPFKKILTKTTNP